MGKKRANGEGSSGWITKKGQKYWRISITISIDPITGNLKRKEIYGKTQKEAKEKLKGFLDKCSKSTDNSTLGGFMYDWLWNVKRKSIKLSTFERWEGIYRMYIAPTKGLNDKKLIDLDTMYIQKVTNEMLKTYNVNQVKKMNDLIRICLNYAVDINKINSNPVIRINYPADHNVQEKRESYICEADQKRLLAEVKGMETEGVIILGLLCGLRLGEALALTETDFDFEKRIIKINKSVKYSWLGEIKKDGKKLRECVVTIPKTPASIRDVPLPNYIIPIIKKLIVKNKSNKLKYGEDYFDKKLVFCRENGLFLDTKKPNRQLKMALKKAEISEDICFHSLRHIFVTNCASAGIDIHIVQKWAGHEDITITMNVYAEFNKDKSKSEYEKINTLFA